MTLDVRRVSAGYRDHQVLHGVDLLVQPGELVTVFGASGSGKTTLLRVIAGLHQPTAGTVKLDGREVTDLPVQRRGIGLVPQEGALFAHRSVAGNIGYGVPRARRRHRVAELLELIGLSTQSRSMPHELSGGQRQRVALARALAPEPRAMLLDEPFSSLDVGLRARLRSETSEILRATRTPAVMITHDLAEALSMSDRIAVLAGGRLLATDTPRALYERPPNERVARWCGPVEMLAGRAVAGFVTTALGRHRMADAIPDGPARVIARPEAFDLRPAPDGEATIIAIEYEGASQQVRVRLHAGGGLTARLSGSDRLRLGGRVEVRLAEPVHAIAGAADPDPEDL